MSKDIKPMLLKQAVEPFDNPDYVYELKLDGERCIAYLERGRTDLKNKRGIWMNPKLPELTDIHKQVRTRCILDGELIVIRDGAPDFFEIQKRSLSKNRRKIDMMAKDMPASFVAYDILYYKDRFVMTLPLSERKNLLKKAVRLENDRLAVSEMFDDGVKLFNITVKKGLEGVVAKRRDSLYYPGIRTDSWVKFKNFKDDDYVICGYVIKANGVASIILGQYRGKQLVFKGHVTLGTSRGEFDEIKKTPPGKPVFTDREAEPETVWLRPKLVCTVKYLMKTSGGGLRHPNFKCLRTDKKPQECVEDISREM